MRGNLTSGLFNRSVFLSLKLHFILFFCIVLLIYFFKKEKEIEKPLDFNVYFQKNLKLSESLINQNEKVTAQELRLGLTELKFNATKSSFGLTVNSDPLQSGDLFSEVFSGVDGYEVARRMSIHTDNKIYHLLSQLHHKIATHIQYPDILVKYKQQGKVVVQFEINSKGELVGDFTLVRSESGYLSVHVLRELRKVFSNLILINNKKLPMEKLRIVAHFNFGIYLTESHLPEKDPAVFKNTLNFYYFSIQNSPASVKSSSGGVYMEFDLEKSYQFLKEHFSPNKEEIDLMQKQYQN